jgi:hypothetical protein
MLTAIRYVLAVALLIGVVWILTTSSSFKACVETQTAASPIALSIVDSAAIRGRCSVHVIFEYRDVATALATVFIALFTFTLWLSTKGMMAATLSAVDLARQEFIATHRPRVIVRYIQGPFHNDEGYRFVWITIVNTGANNAIVEEFGADLALRRDDDDEWEMPGLDADARAIEPIVLTCGQRHVFKVTAKTSDATDKAIFGDALGGHQVCAVGLVRYKDGNGVVRDTGFFRVLDDAGERFVVSPHDAEMEYQD